MSKTKEPLIRATPDVYLGLDNPTQEEWDAWHRAMLGERARASIDATAYRDSSTDWSDTTFRQFFLFMYDTSFYDRDKSAYRTSDLIDRWMAMFGRIDSVLLWHAYPRLGFDSRTQFDFYRDMPGGLSQLREQVSDVLHARGIRVFVDYNPWDAGTYDELGEIVARLDADGVMLDTMTDAPDELSRAVKARANKKSAGVVFAPELRLRESDLARHRQSWAQWIDMGDPNEPSILHHRWLLPTHRQLSIRRWDASRRQEIGYSFFNGSGLILWDNIFGSWNPYSREDRRLIAETAAILDHYQDVLVYGEWSPLIPTGARGLDANRWTSSSATSRTIITLRNRTTERLHYRVPANPSSNLTYVAFWGDKHEVSAGDTIAVEPGAVQALVLDDAVVARNALAHFHHLGERADTALPDYEERHPELSMLRSSDDDVFKCASQVCARSAGVKETMIEMPAGDFRMNVRHERRECGCYPFGASDDATWGWFYKDTLTHSISASVKRYAIGRAAVTNDAFLAFVRDASYRPKDPERFLMHIVREPDGSLPPKLSSEQGALPVTYVSLDDARAYAAFNGQRLPTEAEWQWAAEGAGRGNTYPWGKDPRSFPTKIQPASTPTSATLQGVMGLSGNTWELTESEYTDGHTRFVMLRGGIFLPPGESEWLITRGARPNDYHAKYILLSDGLDRSETVSFRTVVDLE